MLIEQIQTQLESLYGIGLPQRAGDFLIGREEALNYWARGEEKKIPKELFFVRKPEDDTVEIALFLDIQLLHNLKRNDPLVSVNDKNLSDFLILIEGVSHFVYFLWKAHREVPITKLELELQAEIDKFLMLYFFLKSDSEPGMTFELFERLFEDFHLMGELSIEDRRRYLTASSLACRYCYQILKKFVGLGQVKALIEEIRYFYCLRQEDKIKHILN